MTLTERDQQLPLLYETINGKDEEILELQQEVAHFQKQILQQDQLADRLRHFEAQQNGSLALQTELQEARDKINQLLLEQERLKAKTPDKTVSNNPEVPETNSVGVCLTKPMLDKEVAMRCLEDKFMRTMNTIANLTEEKQSLEHLVTQLQGETETIGEYIALYQRQRGLLQQRTLEKDEQLKRLVADREKVRNKLDMLNSLIHKWMQEQGPVALDALKELQHVTCEEHAKEHDLRNGDQAQQPQSEQHNAGVSENEEETTAKQIMVLLSEIKSSNLVQPNDGSDDFHPCPWCYGQLETV